MRCQINDNQGYSFNGNLYFTITQYQATELIKPQFKKKYNIKQKCRLQV